MSYAGPVSRARHSTNLEPLGSSETTGRSGFRTATPLRSRPNFGGRRDTLTAFAAGIALGLTIGAGAALLFAPQAGTDTRRAIVQRGRRLSRRGHDAWDDLREELSRAARRGRQAFRRRRRSFRESMAE